MSLPELDSTAAAELFFAGAVAAGLRRVVISPGSRSTPLTLAAAHTPGLPWTMHLDERTAAFAALGEAKVSGEPVALVCTSGTAAANYVPAVAEASMSRVPLVVITADRPPEHQLWGVGQSFDQRGLYGRHVCDEITMPVGGSGGSAFTERAGWRAVQTAHLQHRPLHVNWAFRLPLEPQGAVSGRSSALEAPVVPESTAVPGEVETFGRLLESARHPVMIAGPDAVNDRNEDRAQRLLAAAGSLGIPVIADALSGLWGHGELVGAAAHVVHRAPHDPDLVIRVGHTPTSKDIRLWWEDVGSGPHVLFDPLDEWQDPSHASTHRLRGSAVATLEAVAASSLRHDRDNHRDAWMAAGRDVEAAITTLLDGAPTMTEAHVARTVHRTRPAAIVTSSSMPVRDLDFFGDTSQPLVAFANRGINGIDGVVATGIGASRAIGDRVLVHIGDVALLHDLGSVLDAARNGAPLTIVVPNNDGGGIFSNLPIRTAVAPDTFDTLFHTPHGQDFAFLDGVDGIRHVIASTEDALHGAITSATSGVVVIEVPVTTPERLSLAEQIRTARSA